MDPVNELRAWLATLPADGAELRLSRPDVKALVDEVLRLRQSNDRLRKQNRKVRGKVARLRGGDEGEGEDAEPDEVGEKVD